MRTLSRSNRIFPALAALLALVSASGCGNWMKRIPLKADASSVNTSSGSGDSSAAAGTNSNFACPAAPNVVPDYDNNLDGTDRFTVCQGTQNNSDILVHGSTEYSPEICIFPAQIVDPKHIYLKPDPKTGGPMYQCVQASSSGVYASFPATNYNAVFIVEGPEQQQMETCLTGGQYAFCPPYSFGQFR